MSGWGLFEEEKPDYLGLLVGWVSAAVAFTVDAPFVVFNFVAGLALALSEVVTDYVGQAIELAGFAEWWALEHTVMALAFVCMVPSLLRKNKGDCHKMLLQFVSNIKALMWIVTFFHFVQGLQGGVIFGGKLHYPTLFLLGLLLRGFNLNFAGTMNEIHGYGMDDGPPDVKTQKVIGMFDKGTMLEAAIAYSIATFGLPDVNCDGEDLRPWLVVCPLIGFITMLDEWSKDQDGAPEAKVAADTNGDVAPVPEEPAKEAEEPAKETEEPVKEAAAEEPKEEEPKAEEEKKVEEAEKEPEKVSPVAKVCGLCQDLVGKVLGLVCSVVSKVKSVVMCVVDKVLALPWACILETISSLGTHALIFLVAYHLTDGDPACFAFPALVLALPLVMAKAEAKGLVTKATGHLVNEAAKSSMFVVQYWLFSQHISKPI